MSSWSIVAQNAGGHNLFRQIVTYLSQLFSGNSAVQFQGDRTVVAAKDILVDDGADNG